MQSIRPVSVRRSGHLSSVVTGLPQVMTALGGTLWYVDLSENKDHLEVRMHIA